MNTVHQRVVELLPWFVNGSLADSERRLIQHHVNECLPCRRALQDERNIHSTIRNLKPPSIETAGLDRLMQTIDRDSSWVARTVQARAGWRMPQFHRVAGIAAAASLALVALGAWVLPTNDSGFAGFVSTDAAAFSTLSASGPAQPLAIDVVFRNDVDESEIQSLITELNGAVVTGPSDLGRYTLSLKASSNLDSTIEQLREHPLVRFAGESFIPEDPK